MKYKLKLGSHHGGDIHRLGRRDLIASDSLRKFHRQSIPTNCPHSALSSSSYWQSDTRFFYKQRCFSDQSQCCLTVSWFELRMLLRCCLVYIIMIIPRRFSYLVYLCPCLDLSLFMSHYVIYCSVSFSISL